MHGIGIRGAALGVLLAMVSIAGCATSRSDFVVALPNGYQIVRGGKADEPMIRKRGGGAVIPGPVTRYTVVRDVVVGETGDKTYFLIDTRSGEISKDLSEADYTERLKASNITSAPELSPPVLPK
jgi:hypothetical protein